MIYPPYESAHDDWQRSLWLAGYETAIQEAIDDSKRLGLTTTSVYILEMQLKKAKQKYSK